MRHPDRQLLVIQDRKDFKMVQVPKDSNVADAIAKPLEGQRIRYLMNFIGYWRSEDQARVGERERKVREEKKNFAGKVNKLQRCL